jgi:putative membrane-bound dehydrogenase-like protein
MSRLPLLALCLLPLTADAADTYRVGTAQADISPTHPIRLNGFGFRRTESEGVYHRIWARALAIEDDSKEPTLLITVDVLGIPDDIRAELGQRFARKAKLNPERLAITATHTHTGPMLKGANTTLFGVPIPKEHLDHIDKYTVEFLDKLEQAGLDALKSRKPARLSYAVGKVTFAKNRRTAGGPVDHDLPVLFVHDAESGKVRAVYTSYACHCVTLSFNKVGGDWAGFAAEAIQSAYPDSVALVSVGCGADANPTSNVTGDKVEAAQLQGREIAAEVKRLAGNFLAPVSGKITPRMKTIELPLAPLPTRAEWEEKAKRTNAIGHHARVQLEKLDRKQALLTKIDYPIQTWAFGDTLAMAFLPGEVVVDYALRLKKELDGQRLWVNAYANGAPCYIPSERVLKEGGYEGGGAMIYYDIPVPFKPGLEEPIVLTVKGQLGKTFPPKFDASKTRGSLPMSPQQSLAAIRTKANLTVELVAAEPLINSPVAIDFGPDGKLWVCEMIDYPQGKAGKFEPGGRVRFLEMNKDGKFDKATTFIDNIPFPTGVTVWRKGVLICAAPDILYAEDTDGDGKADVVKKLFSGFGTENYQGRVNSLQYGLDGWVYGACGLFGGNIKSFNGKTYPLGNRDFRIKPDTGELEPVTGVTQQGRVRDDWGNWFGCDNSTLIRHYPLDDHYLKRNPYVTYPNTAVHVPADPNPNRLYPIKQDQQRFQLSGPPNTVTAACGLGIYRDDLLGEDYRGNAFTCEPVNLCVHRLKLTPKGCTFEGHRPADEKESEFLASTDNWFRPVQAVTGPDGCLWVVDMYRYVIEHPRWIPPQDAAQVDLRAGAGMGRIYRVRPKGLATREWERLARKTSDDLVSAMQSRNGWTRDLAVQLLVWRDAKDPAVVAGLKKLLQWRATPLFQLTGLRALDGLGALSKEDLWEAALRDELAPGGPDRPVSPLHGPAVRMSERFLSAKRDSAIDFGTLRSDPDPRVRLQVAYTLGLSDHPTAAETLGRMAIKNADDPYITAAVLSSLTEKNLPGVLATVLKEADESGPPPAFVAQLVRMAAATKNDKAQAELLAAASTPRAGKFARWQFEALAGYFDQPTKLAPELANRITEAQTAALRVVTDPKAPDADRMAALRLVGRGTELTEGERTIFRDLLSAAASPGLRTATVSHLARLKDPAAINLVLEGWKAHPPATRTQVFDLLLARKDGPPTLLAAVEAKAIAAGEIDAARRQRLLNHPDRAIRDRAAKVFDGAASPDRAKVIAAYADVTGAGDKDKGKAVFARVCAACHKLGEVGVHVGPDLAALANRTPAYLMQEILDPNRNLDSRYVEYQAQLKDGRNVTGLLAAETATTIILRGQQRKEETLLRSDIEELRGSGKSLMPEGLEKDLPKKDMTDLLTFLTAVRPSPKVFLGNTPTLVTPTDGHLRLRAEHAEIYGGEIAFEGDFKNVGMWHGPDDRAEWRVSLPKAGTFDMYLDYACDAHSGGNELAIEGGESPVRWKVASTGAWSEYRTTKIGTVKLPAGDGRIIVRPAGPLRGALIDLRTVYLVPPGETPKAAVEAKDPTDAPAVAKLILDDTQPADWRSRLIANNATQSAELIGLMAADIKDAKEEYRRIPWIWRVAIAAGKRNDAKELRAILAVTLPNEKEPLRDWQAVVVGGGVINGITQAGAWPGRRLAELLRDDPKLAARWQAALKQSLAMADNDKVAAGTRYDALRMVALADWDAAGPVLTKYLGKDANAELQMGAVSGLGDVESPAAAELLVKRMADFTRDNRSLAVAAMVRTPERAKMLVDALASSAAKAEWLDDAARKALLNHPDAAVRARAERLLPAQRP